MRFSPYDNPIILVLGNVNIVAKFQGVTPNGAVEWRWGMKIGDFWPTSWPISRCISEMVEDRRIQPARRMLGVERAFQRCEGFFGPRGVPAKIHTMHLLQLSYNFRCTDARSQRQLCFLLRDTWTRILALAHLVCLSIRTVFRTILSRHDCPVF